MGNAAKVGAITLIFLGLLWATYLALGRSLLGSRLPSYKIHFKDAGGVAMGTRVRLAGVQIGIVRKIRLLTPTDAEAEFQLEIPAPIPVGTVAVVPSSLVGLGDTTIDLVPPAQSPALLAAGATIEGRKAGPLEGVLPGGSETVKGLATEAEKTLRAIRNLLEDKAFTDRTKTLLATLDKTVTKFGAIGSRVDGLLADNQATLQSSLRSVSVTLTNVQATSEEIARFAKSGQLQGDTKILLADLKRTAAETKRLVARFNQLANDPALADSLANLKRMTGSGAKIAAVSEETAASAARIAKTGEGIALNGQEVSARLITLADRANEIAARATVLEDQLSGILGRFGGRPAARPAPNGLPADTSSRGSSPLSFGLEADLLRETRPNHNRVDLTIRVPVSPTNTISLGLYDAFESNRLTAQYGSWLSPSLGVRYGLYAGKPGVGVDYALGSRLSLRGDLWSLNSPRLDLRARYEFRPGVVGWVGLDRTFGANAPTVGLGILR